MILKAFAILVMLGSALGGSGRVTEFSNLTLFNMHEHLPSKIS